MSTRRILHAADIHLDSPLRNLESYDQAPLEQIRGASRRALENLVRLAIDQNVDLVVIAGDLYDGDWREQNTGLFFVGQAAKLTQAGIPLVVIRGNHDAENVMTSSLPLPKNPDGSEIMLASKRVDCREFESIGVAVHGRSFRNKAELEDLSRSYPRPHRGMFNLGLLHTSLTGAEGHDTYSPCTPADLAAKEYDYWALGHVHTRGEHHVPGEAPIVFSGNIQGRHIRECGAKGCYILDIDDRGKVDLNFHPLDVVRWEAFDVEAAELESTDAIIDAYQTWLGERISEIDDRLLVSRVSITGATPLHNQLHQQRHGLESSLRAIAISQGAGQAWMEKFRLRTTPPHAKLDVGDTEGPMASVSKIVESLRVADDRGQRIASEFASLIKKLPGQQESLDTSDLDWVDELIESAAADLLGRLEE
ncbi:metallophosphoesterase family protein [Allorhodopirellula solitaria]|uniref:Putative metallophosphoesterase YhaO n=1 Tax=Allorhodopirellula solitaria TaxID=2527987 RepID=A0A5C5XA12_9BACT|nr:DNA repair exonuclease [Allorhodopirellula solitaria]TWT59241.1 putative metallophosphoesterase YhaO [Allorhodopirellula solitaria]